MLPMEPILPSVVENSVINSVDRTTKKKVTAAQARVSFSLSLAKSHHQREGKASEDEVYDNQTGTILFSSSYLMILPLTKQSP